MSTSSYNCSHLAALRIVKDRRKITGKRLSEATGITESSLSQFFRGNSDVNVTTLDRIVDGMEQISYGARREYIQVLAEIAGADVDGAITIEQQINDLPKESKKQLIMTIVESLASENSSEMQLVS